MSELCLIRVILPVTDVEAAASFYAHLLDMPGSRVIRRADITSTGGGTILACYDALADGDPEHVGSNPQNVSFSVDDLDAAYKRARNGGCRDLTAIEVRP